MRSGDMHKVEHAEEAFACYSSSNMVYSSGTLRFVYQSMVSPRSVFDYNMDTK